MIKNINKDDLTVIDFFCWAWGFSEWFRQQWFKIIQWIDYWQPAITTHNLNHWLNDTIKSVLDFWSEDSWDVSEIEELEDTLCIIWSPPCVSFSSSNKSWKADKTHWIKLIEAFLRTIAVKKHKPNSKLKAWYMENVPNSQKFVEEKYSFEKLNLSEWAKKIWICPSDTALIVRNNWGILDSWDYWAPQSRKRFVSWEWCETWEFINPVKTHQKHITSWEVIRKLPKPSSSKIDVYSNIFTDPNYKNLSINWSELTDHFYDTWLYIIEWAEAQYLKQNHSFMWRMSFPENEDKPCRTIMATRSAKTRESLIYKSEYNRKWNWEYRLPTIREISSLMGFPINYQFTWSEWSKWRQIWNAVSPHLSSALAKEIKNKLGLKIVEPDFLDLKYSYEKVEIKLNTFEESKFDKPKRRNANSKFRKHPFKSGNITVELMNYIESDDVTPWSKWHIQMFFWTWLGFNQIVIDKNKYSVINEYLGANIKEFKSFKIDFCKYYDSIKYIDIKKFQQIYELDVNLEQSGNPINIIKQVWKLIQNRIEKDQSIDTIGILPKKEVPLWQLYIIFCLWSIIFKL